MAREFHEWDYEAFSARIPMRMVRRWMAFAHHEHQALEADRMERDVEARRRAG